VRKRELINSDIEDWRISFVETGYKANLGERLMAVKPYLEGEKMFMANYADGLTDLPLPQYLEFFRANDAVASFVSVAPNVSYHFVTADENGGVTSIRDIVQSGLRINAGYFAFRKEIFDYMRPGEELVLEPFARLMADRKLLAYSYDGFWAPMDTAKDKKRLDDLHEAGNPPWCVWQHATTRHSLTLHDGRVQFQPHEAKPAPPETKAVASA
jgi:glucose-1-phosphate cytidylyltransferase